MSGMSKYLMHVTTHLPLLAKAAGMRFPEFMDEVSLNNVHLYRSMIFDKHISMRACKDLVTNIILSDELTTKPGMLKAMQEAFCVDYDVLSPVFVIKVRAKLEMLKMEEAKDETTTCGR